MPQHIVRIELHNYPKADDYDVLHREMAARGFSRTIQADDGKRYHLPDATYQAAKFFAIKQCHDEAVAAAKATGHPAGVLVAEYTKALWSGLAETSTLSDLLGLYR